MFEKITINNVEYINISASVEILMELGLSESEALNKIKELELQEVQNEKNKTAQAYLTSTDWYVIRKQETSEDIPKEILDKRADARNQIIKGDK